MATNTVELTNYEQGVTLLSLVNRRPDLFKQQDWYYGEPFTVRTLLTGTFSGANTGYSDPPTPLPLAVECVWQYIAAWQSQGIKLWQDNYVWCRDVDSNGDQIYVGMCGKDMKFEIHRHLKLRPVHQYSNFQFKPLGA